jgi:hypothetical protein
MTDHQSPIERICELTGLDALVIKKLGKLGCFPGPKKGLYDEMATIRGICRYLWEQSKAPRGRPTEGNQKLPTYPSRKNCEAATGLPVGLLSQLHSEGCSAFRFNRIDLGLLLQEIGPRIRLEPKGGNQQQLPFSTTSAGARASLDIVRTEREKVKLLKEQEKVIHKDDVQAGCDEGMSELFSAMDRKFLNELPPSLVGCDEIQIRDKAKKQIDEVKREFESRIQQITKGETE